jgi:erythronate-4-phosphate dehydrogenase
MRILADSNMCRVEQVFADLGEVQLVDGRQLSAADIKPDDLLLVRSVTEVGRSLLSEARPGFVGSATSGTDHLDLDWLTQEEIPFAHAPGSNANSVVEYVISAISHCGDSLETLMSGGRLGIVGYGMIGRRLLQRCTRMGIACVANDPWLTEAGSAATGAVESPLVSLEEVLACDVICLHAELTDREPWPSRHLLEAEQLAQLSPQALLINAGRGPLIDNAALLKYLEGDRCATVVLDVWEQEPRIDEALLQRSQFATPHIAGYSYDGKLLATRMLYRAACEVLALACVEPLASVGAQGANVSEVVAPTQLSDAEFVRWLQLQSYDIRRDDRRMRERAGSDFDQQRKEYPQRRELAATRLMNYADLGERQQSLCQAMGCMTVNTDD